VNDADLLTSIESDARRIAEAFDVDPSIAVPSCPGWNLGDLVDHHAGVLQWAEATVRTGSPGVQTEKPPAERHARRAWYLDAARQFVATASATERDRECWTFDRPPGTVWFWIRRQALEAAVHRYDSDSAIGAVPTVSGDLAAVGVDEVVHDLFPRQIALGRADELTGPIELRAVDIDSSWILPGRSGPGGVIRSTAPMLFLVLWQRVGLDDPRLDIDLPDDLLAEVRAARFTP
jgi:uncharacterized protein (TIGR03083 family)